MKWIRRGNPPFFTTHYCVSQVFIVPLQRLSCLVFTRTSICSLANAFIKTAGLWKSAVFLLYLPTVSHYSLSFVRPDHTAAPYTLPAGGCNAALIIRQSLFMGSPTDANRVHPVGRAAHIRVTSLKTGFWGVYEDSDRDVAITPRSMGTSSGTKQGQRKLLLDSFSDL